MAKILYLSAFALLLFALFVSSLAGPIQYPSSKTTLLSSEDFQNGLKLLTTSSDHVANTLFDFSLERVLRPKNNSAAGAASKNGNRYASWPYGIVPYEISSLYTAAERSVIAGAISEFQTKTCVRFVQRTNEVDYLHITPDDGQGGGVSPYCYSYVGRQGGRQFVKMFTECVRLPAMIHELGHAIGFEHEHNRVDRDSYIDVLWNNINPVYYYAFDKVSQDYYDTLGLVYDYYSIMHYPDYSFANPGQKSFRLKYAGDVSSENQRLSPTDVQKFNKYYGC